MHLASGRALSLEPSAVRVIVRAPIPDYALDVIDRLALDDPRWTELVDRLPGALPFHHPAWALTISRCYGFEGFALALRGTGEGREEYVAGFPVIELRTPLTRRRRWSSLPFTDTCPALVSPDDGPALARAAEAYRIASGAAELELSGPLPGVPSATSAQRVHHVLALEPDVDAVERRYRASVRRNIRTARNVGLRLRRGATASDMLDIFYPLHLRTRRRLGLPPQPRRFFRRVWEELLAPGLGHLTIVEASGSPVAAAVFLSWKDVTVYKYGASDPSAWSLRPNNLLFAEEIAAAAAAGRTRFHFGRTDVHDEGLRRFKLGWGAEEEPVESTWFGTQPKTERIGPPAALRALVRRSPPLLARTVGEALYRYVA